MQTSKKLNDHIYVNNSTERFLNYKKMLVKTRYFA